MTGAALFGARGTGAFVSRKARLTYGVRGSRRFDHNDPEHMCREEVGSFGLMTRHNVLSVLLSRGCCFVGPRGHVDCRVCKYFKPLGKVKPGFDSRCYSSFSLLITSCYGGGIAF